MANYSIINSTDGGAGQSEQAIAATYKTLICVAASSVSGATFSGQLRRGAIYDILVGTNGVPADNYLEWDVARVTAGATTTNGAGSISSVSSNYVLDPADAGFVGYAMINSSNEGNITPLGTLWGVGINQRASYRWVAAPGSELIYPAVSSGTGSNGLALRAKSAGYTGTATGTVMFSER